MATALRRCAECDVEFAWTSRNPTRRFCGPGCRGRWWRAQRLRAAEAPEPTEVRYAAEPGAGLGALHECPNCGEHLTVINLLVPDTR
jgi:endogenous inhibitor of DNA gyrase (YacG/DUF329 family)